MCKRVFIWLFACTLNLNFYSLQEIFNHVLADIEFFIGKVGAALAQEDGKKKKKKDKSAVIYGKLQQCGLSERYIQYIQVVVDLLPQLAQTVQS